MLAQRSGSGQGRVNGILGCLFVSCGRKQKNKQLCSKDTKHRSGLAYNTLLS